MTYKWIGAILVVAGCGGFGFSLASAHRREIQLLRHLNICVQYMQCELKYRLTPLPDLCRQAGRECGGVMKAVFGDLSRELERQISPDVSGCMATAVRNHRDQLPGSVRKLLFRLGKSLGRFDLPGQLRGLESVSAACMEELAVLNQNRDIRFRNYQTLGLCAGIALVILFL